MKQMNELIEEAYGKQTLANLFTYVWTGNWDQYEQAFNQMPVQLKELFPFHANYNREQVSLWYENYFYIPGDYFVAPYYSSYLSNGETDESRKHSLLGLLGMYEKYGFYFPLEKGYFPDHIGCMTAFVSSAIQEQIKALEQSDKKTTEEMFQVEAEIRAHYIEPTLSSIQVLSEEKIDHPFFKSFIQYYAESIKQEWSLPTF